jgi:hypothetical protein
MHYSGTTLTGYSRSLAILSLLVGAAALCSAVPITWTINGTFNDGGTATGTFVFDPDLGVQTISTFNIAVAGGTTGTFFPFDYTPATSHAVGPVIANQGSLQFESDNNYTGGEPYVLQFVPASALSDAGGVINIMSSGFSNNCFDCFPFRAFVSGTITAAGTPAPPSATPAPPSLLLILVGLACAGLYAARRRLLKA